MNNIKPWLCSAILMTLMGGCTTLDPYRSLRNAIHNHAPDQAQALLNAHPRQISATDALIVAAQVGDMAAVELFIAQGAAINQRNAEGEVALTAAARQGNAQMVEHLVKRGADLHQRDGRGTTALDYAKQWSPETVALGDQKEMIVQYLTELATGKQAAMVHIAQAIAERRAHVWDNTDTSEEKIRVVNLYAPIVIR